MTINNLIVVSDLHCGCRMGLCLPEGVALDDGGRYMPSSFQKRVWEMWQELWSEWVPDATNGEPYQVVFNGDLVDGVHHKATTTISNNMTDQRAMAIEICQRVANLKKCKSVYVVRGTEAHGGLSGTDEETIAKAIDAIPSSDGQYARWALWKMVGGGLVHLLHHIGTTGSAHYESTAVHKELCEAFAEAGRWGNRPPDVVVRSHRHRAFQTRIQTHRGSAIAAVTAGWQGKTPFAFRIPGARQSEPQFGGLLVRQAKDGELYVRERVWSLERPQPE